eukprot:scaffold3855_cov108-Isochrysis_galbana.AAC.4
MPGEAALAGACAGRSIRPTQTARPASAGRAGHRSRPPRRAGPRRSEPALPRASEPAAPPPRVPCGPRRRRGCRTVVTRRDRPRPPEQRPG